MTISESYNLWADSYDSDDNKTRDLDKTITKNVLGDIEFQHVLELGCGTGKNTEYLIKRATSVTGIDASEKMLEIAKQKIRSKNVTFQRGDLLSSWPANEQSIDLVTCNLVLEHLQHINPVFKKTFDVLTDKGFFFLSELHPFKQYLGSGARFQAESTIHHLTTYQHSVSEFVQAAVSNGFNIIRLDEWSDPESVNKPPRLLSLLLQK